MVLTDLLIEDPKIANFFQPRIKMGIGADIEIFNHGLDEWVQLNSFQDGSNDEESDKYYKYFNSLIRLFSAISFNRNHKAIKAL